ncbi:MAG: hypothetical protein M1812_003362 [Candelaria pacifica]|nr:MAG: hypothetical protein M1812_003362 [Candelaria pacifica]
MTISSGIVFIFTSLLFLSGYVLQQQTVHNIQRAIRPPPKPSPKPTPSVVAQNFGDPPGSKGHNAYQIEIASSQPAEGWKKVAYAQTGLQCCDDLRRASQAEKSSGKGAAIPKDLGGVNRNGRPLFGYKQEALKKGSEAVWGGAAAHWDYLAEDRPTSYSLASLFALINYSRVLYLPPSGLLLKASLLDGLLTSPLEQSLLAMPAGSDLAIDSSSLLLVRPSNEEHDHILSSILSAESSVESPFKNLLSDPASTRQSSSSAQDYPLLAQTSSLQQLPDDVKVNSFWSSTGYARISDAGLPGPEYDIPQADLLKAMPSSPSAKRIWEELYEKFRDHRMDICGLDLEPWRKEEK